ncbi:hypothetical protein AYL99_11604 [Fonsecaea erecta]|uniref:Uncharacterized protein n=1 Tax=Fonsecaea erecta TaxID=1367422 RepID=A0A178Z2S9_9EURO|nr:hypothetical protein AYL99_11604 [Fonsecaea erecta]OAP54070.1 hypothetical protein AYL99_11604 [Fonsecaea erecta]
MVVCMLIDIVMIVTITLVLFCCILVLMLVYIVGLLMTPVIRTVRGWCVRDDEHPHDHEERMKITGSATTTEHPIRAVSSKTDSDSMMSSTVDVRRTWYLFCRCFSWRWMPMITYKFPCPFPFLNVNIGVDESTLVMTTCRTCDRQYIEQMAKIPPYNRASMFSSSHISSNIAMGMNEYHIALSLGLGRVSVLTCDNHVAYMPLNSITDRTTNECTIVDIDVEDQSRSASTARRRRCPSSGCACWAGAG